jgi:hypothetical protein
MENLERDLANALGVSKEEAAIEIEDSGIARLNSIEYHQICEGCGFFKGEHLPEDNYGKDCNLA